MNFNLKNLILDNQENITESNKKSEKKDRLLDSGLKLFTEKGIVKTSIQDIADKSDVGKGTFYLYFRDKYELRDVLIMRESKKIFDEALEALKKTEIKVFTEQVVFIIDYVIDVLTKNQILLKFISKDLSSGVFDKAFTQLYTKQKNEVNGNNVYDMFMRGVEKNKIKLKNPEVTLYMIVELVSSTCFNCILYKKPIPIKEYKPILYEEIRKMINEK